MDCLYADPDRKVYNLLGLYYGVGRTFFNPASAKVFSRFEALRKAVQNYTIEATPDDRSSVLQQGGMFVFKGKQLLYARKDEGTGDHASLDDVFNICCKVPVAWSFRAESSCWEIWYIQASCNFVFSITSEIPIAWNMLGIYNHIVYRLV